MIKNPDPEFRNMSIEKCKEIILEILDGQPEAIQVFEHFIQGYSPCRAKMRSKAHNFVERVKVPKETRFACSLLVWCGCSFGTNCC
jgi:hypothetical protein